MPLPSISEHLVERTGDEWTAELEAFIQSGDCEMTGVARLRPEGVFDHQETDFSTIIMLGVQHDYEELHHAPELRGGKDVTRQYLRAADAANKVAGWLKE